MMSSTVTWSILYLHVYQSHRHCSLPYYCISLSSSHGQAARRQTVCPGNLARDIRPFPELKPLITTARTPRRVTFASSPMMTSPAFQPYFDHSSFEQHLDDISPVVLPESETITRRRPRLLGRPSFLPAVSNSCDFTDEESTDSDSICKSIQAPPTILADAQVCWLHVVHYNYHMCEYAMNWQLV